MLFRSRPGRGGALGDRGRHGIRPLSCTDSRDGAGRRGTPSGPGRLSRRLETPARSESRSTRRQVDARRGPLAAGSYRTNGGYGRSREPRPRDWARRRPASMVPSTGLSRGLEGGARGLRGRGRNRCGRYSRSSPVSRWWRSRRSLSWPARSVGSPRTGVARGSDLCAAAALARHGEEQDGGAQAGPACSRVVPETVSLANGIVARAARERG